MRIQLGKKRKCSRGLFCCIHLQKVFFQELQCRQSGRHFQELHSAGDQEKRHPWYILEASSIVLKIIWTWSNRLQLFWGYDIDQKSCTRDQFWSSPNFLQIVYNWRHRSDRFWWLNLKATEGIHLNCKILPWYPEF
jgi:hypothetical protein